jgi:predicted dehydrogenase
VRPCHGTIDVWGDLIPNLKLKSIAMSKIGIAILGVGRWGVHWVRNFLAHPEVEVKAIVDANPERLTALSQQFQFDDTLVLATDWQEVRSLPGLDAVVVVTPASTHYPLIADALQQGYHVLAEKPLTLYPEESLALCQLAEQQQRQLIVDHTYLFHPCVLNGQTVVREGSLGELRYGYAERTHLGPVRPDVDALWDLAIHDIAIFNTWLGEMPIRVQATGQVWLQPNTSEPSSPETPVQSLADRQLFPIGLSDLVWVTLTYPSGFQATLHLCWFNPDKQRRLAVVGERGTLIFDEMDAIEPLTIQYGRVEPQGLYWIPTDQRREVVEVAPAEPLKQVCQHFIDCVQNRQPSEISSGWVGANLVKVLWAITESVNQGGKAIDIGS